MDVLNTDVNTCLFTAAGKYTINTRHTTWSWERQEMCRRLRYQASTDHLDILQVCTVASPPEEKIKSTFQVWSVTCAAARCRWSTAITGTFLPSLLLPFICVCLWYHTAAAASSVAFKPDGRSFRHDLRSVFSCAAECRVMCGVDMRQHTNSSAVCLVNHTKPSEQKSCIHAFHADASKRHTVLSAHPSKSLSLLLFLYVSLSLSPIRFSSI